MSAAMGIDAADIYGLSEVMGPGVASECIETKDGPVLWEDHFYPEIIDPVTGEVLPDGEIGELVFTTLTKEAFPVLRYRTRDLTRLLPGTARPGMRRMEKITGRTDDMMIVHVEAAPGIGSAGIADAKKRLVHDVKAYVGISVDVNVAPPGSIERSAGKARRVIDKRNLQDH